MGGEGSEKAPKKCHTFFEWPLNQHRKFAFHRSNVFRYFHECFTSAKVDIFFDHVSEFGIETVSKLSKTESPKLNLYRIALLQSITITLDRGLLIWRQINVPL